MDAQFTDPADDSVLVTTAVSFYAKWTTPLPSYQIGFVLEDGGEINYQTYKAGAVIDIDSYIPERENKKFTGWYYDEDHTKAATGTITVNGPLYLYSSWTNDFKMIPITLVYNNGQPNGTHEVQIGRGFTRTTKLPLTSTAPDGKLTQRTWYLDEALTQPIIDELTVTEPFTVYCFWAEEEATVTYHNVNNDPDNTKQGSKGYVGIPFYIGSKSNYGEANGLIFAGWYTDSALTNRVEGDYIVPESSTLDLYAKWSDDICTVTVHTNNLYDTIDTYNVAGGTYFDSISLKSLGTKNFHEFEKYYLDEECTIPVPDDYIVNGNVDIYAGWTRKTMTLKFKLNNGQPMIGVEVEEGLPINLYEIVSSPEKDGFTFVGWYEDKSCTKPIEDPEQYIPRSAYSTVYAYYDDTWGALADTSWYDNAEAGAVSYSISEPKELAGLAKLVNAGTDTFEGKTIELDSSIDLNGYKWTAIGELNYDSVGESDNPYEFNESDFFIFKGTFDGNGNTISNISIDKGSNNSSFDQRKSYLGLFGVIGNGATISNLTIENVTIQGDSFIGSLVGYVASETGANENETTIKDITIKGDIEITGGACLGGVVGRSEAVNTKTLLENITVSANTGSVIKSGADTGYSPSYAYIGGIIGVSYSNNGNTMKNCSVTGLDFEAVYSSVGGLAGGFGNGSISDSSVSDSTITLRKFGSGSIEEKAIGALVGTPVGSGSISFTNVSATSVILETSATTEELPFGGYVGAQDAVTDIADRVSGLPKTSTGITIRTN